MDLSPEKRWIEASRTIGVLYWTAMGMDGHMSHCDPLVLHSPEAKCQYCDLYPRAQVQRKNLGINFTGEHDDTKVLCPSEVLRPIEKINRWYGNVAETKQEAERRSKEWNDQLRSYFDHEVDKDLADE